MLVSSLAGIETDPEEIDWNIGDVSDGERPACVCVCALCSCPIGTRDLCSGFGLYVCMCVCVSAALCVGVFLAAALPRWSCRFRSHQRLDPIVDIHFRVDNHDLTTETDDSDEEPPHKPG